ncbi:MAG: xanthine dehydrogenase family protein subunit M [Desulfobacterales bacterium]|nr:xanthine dehydrogenase family protein subunit M [Desulfobacterales bacterium]
MFRNLPRFEFLSPKTLEEAVVLMRQYGQKVKVMAGGTDLVPQMKNGGLRPEYVLSLNQIGAQTELRFDEGSGLKIGALCRIADIERSPVVKEHYPVLSQAASVLGSTEIRNRGTVGGNLCNAAPSADMAPSLLVLGARAVVASSKGERVVPLEAFFVGPGKTVLEKDELLVRLEMPPMKPGSAGEYIKLGIRKAMDIAVVGVAAVLALNSKDGVCVEAKLALGAVAPTPMRAKKAENRLIDKKINEEIIGLAAETASEEASPVTDIRASTDYRRAMVQVLTRRAIEHAFDQCIHSSTKERP